MAGLVVVGARSFLLVHTVYAYVPCPKQLSRQLIMHVQLEEYNNHMLLLVHTVYAYVPCPKQLSWQLIMHVQLTTLPHSYM